MVPLSNSINKPGWVLAGRSHRESHVCGSHREASPIHLVLCICMRHTVVSTARVLSLVLEIHTILYRPVCCRDPSPSLQSQLQLRVP